MMCNKLKFTIFIITTLILVTTGVFAEEEKTEGIIKTLSFDPKTAAVSYELAYPARVRIRVGTKEGPLFRTIVDWQERGVGLHKEEWDGFGSSGKVKLAGSRDLVFTFNYFTEDDTFLKNVSLEDIMPHPEQLVVGRFLPSLDINRLHKTHDHKFCYDPELKVVLPKNILYTDGGYIIIKDKTQITVTLSEKDKTWFSRERYSIHIFTDEVFLRGELEGYSPYNFILGPQVLSKGKHIITVNYSGFADHIGIASIPVYIEKEGERIAQAQ